MDKVFVIGHVNPDTDAVASAMGYAWLLRERDGIDAIPSRAGAINPQTAWVLNKLGLEAPLLLTDASPKFESVTKRLDSVTPERPLREAWAIANRTWGVAPVVEDDGTPIGLVTGTSLFQFISKLVGQHPLRQETKLSEILDLPSADACNSKIARFKSSTRIRDALSRVLRQEGDDFWVVDDHGKYLGVCRQRDVLNPPRIKVVLVDHNENRQAISAVEEAELVEVLDHHRLGNPSTHTPISFSVDIVGSTSTLVFERIEKSGFSAPPELAGFLLAGLISDTLLLSSPTTTDRDKEASERLGRWAFTSNSPLADENLQSFGEAIIRAGTDLASRDTDEIINSDLKIYETSSFHFAIAQVEVTNLLQFNEHRDKLQTALNEFQTRRHLDFAVMMVTDVLEGSSRLLLVNEPVELNDLPYPLQPDGSRLAKGVVSRKKQLLPLILGLLEN